MSLEHRLERLDASERIIGKVARSGPLPFYQAVDILRAKLRVRKETAEDYVDFLKNQLRHDGYNFLP